MNNLLTEIAENLTGAHSYGNYITGLCPFHSDSRPSFFVYPDRYYCRACGANGTTQKLAKLLSKEIKTVRYTAASTTKFINPFSVWLKNNSLERVIETAQKILKDAPSHYMKLRGITPEQQVQCGLGIRDGWIIFPIYDRNDKLVGATARAGEENNSTSKYVVPSGQSPDLLYAPDWKLIERSSYLFATYGIIDALTLSVCGFPAVSMLAGKRVNASAFRDIRKRVIIIPDFNEEKEASKLAQNLSWRGKVLWPKYPLHCKDVNDIYVKNRKAMKIFMEISNEQTNPAVVF